MKHTEEEQRELDRLSRYFDDGEFLDVYDYEMEEAQKQWARERIAEICRRAVERGR